MSFDSACYFTQISLANCSSGLMLFYLDLFWVRKAVAEDGIFFVSSVHINQYIGLRDQHSKQPSVKLFL